ncbi:MAG TPA: hypothetical protein VIS99_17765 [Terrimicrobiaceae bacterium]
MKIGLMPQAGQRSPMARQKYRQPEAVLRGSFMEQGYRDALGAQSQDYLS